MTADLKYPGFFEGTFLLDKTEFKPLKTKPGHFFSCTLSDKTGSANGVKWEGIEPLRSWAKNKIVVKASGEVSQYNEQLQLVIKKIEKTDIYDRSLLVPSLSEEKINFYKDALKTINDQLSNPVCKSIWDSILVDETICSSFVICPGGVGSVHHNYLGGLLEHSASMVMIASKTAELNQLDHDILVTGCLIHDIGKIRSYSWDTVLEMSDAGRLLHHTSIGYGMMLEFAREKNISLSDPTFLKLCHIIISHHDGEGIRKPMFAEAVAVASIDQYNAIAAHAVGFIKEPGNKEPESNWTRFCSLTGRQYYNPPMPKEDIDFEDLLKTL